MKKRLPVLAFVAGSVLAAGAWAGPTEISTKHAHNRLSPAPAAVHTQSPAEGDFFDGFEGYDAGSDIVGQGGWEVWYWGGEHAEVSDDTAAEGENSLKLHPASDIVQRTNISEGQWTFSVMTFLPSDSEADGFVVLLNQYESPTDSWSMQVMLSPALGLVESQWDFNSTPTIEDQWVELRCEVDLDADRMNIYYNGELFAPDLVWTENVNPGGITSIACMDLFCTNSENDSVYFDSVSLGGPGKKCPPDLDENGVLDLFDFLAFVNLFNASHADADCNGDGVFDAFDLACFIDDFDAGC